MPKRAELLNEIIDDMIDELGFNKFIEGFSEVNRKSSEDNFEYSMHTFELLIKTRDIVLKRNKPKEIEYYNLLLTGCFVDFSDLLAIELS